MSASSSSPVDYPDSEVGATLRAFVEAQYATDGKILRGCFTKDAVFNGRMFQKNGSKEIEELYEMFLRDAMVSFRVDSAAPTRDNQWIIIEVVRLIGSDKDLIVVDLLTFDEGGKISRLDNCFDMKQVNLPPPPAE